MMPPPDCHGRFLDEHGRPREDPHRRKLREFRVSVPGAAYFLTKCLDNFRSDYLTREACSDIVIGSLDWLRKEGWCHLCGFAVMPNHYHCVLGLTALCELEEVMESVGKYTGRQINRLLGRRGRLWEDGYYDHQIRDRRDFDDILQYMHHNPVEAGLVERPEDWPYSTANERYADWIDWEWLGWS